MRAKRTFYAWIVVFVCVALSAFNTIGSVRASATLFVEELVLLVAPTAERAYHYGVRHFDATDPDEYDIDRAERFFHVAERLDPRHPYLQHQLARIEFLRGDFFMALTRINTELVHNPAPSPSSYYIRGLVSGFVRDYEGAIADYEVYLASDPTNWAAINDYAWVLLKAHRPEDALVAVEKGLAAWPENPWLLNSRATALFETSRRSEALETAAAAADAATHLTEADWLQAYPGNDPLIAKEGLAAFRKAIEDNIHSIALASENGS